MKKLITIYDLNNLEELLKLSDGIIIGSNDFSVRLTKSFEITEINEAIAKTKQLNKEIFLNVNQMFTDEQIKKFMNYFSSINSKDLTGIIVADLGTMIALKQLNLQSKVVYNPETLLTNATDFNYLSSDQIKGAYVGKELTIEDIEVIGQNKLYQLFMTGHGHLNMFYSKRKLLDNYQEWTNRLETFNDLQNLTITEPNRKDSPYPILQDKAGTHVFRSKVMNSLEYLERLEKVVDYFIIDTIFKSDNYATDILKLYETKDELKINEIQTKYNESWDNGFLDNKTYYKRQVKKR